MPHEAFFEFFWKADSIDRCKTFKAFESPPFFLTNIMEWLQSLHHSTNVLFPVNVPMLSCTVRLENNLLIEDTPNVFFPIPSIWLCLFTVFDVSWPLASLLFSLYCIFRVHNGGPLECFFLFPPVTFTVRSHTRWCIILSDVPPATFRRSLSPSIRYFGWFFFIKLKHIKFPMHYHPGTIILHHSIMPGHIVQASPK